MVYSGDKGFFEAVPQEEFHLASLIGEQFQPDMPDAGTSSPPTHQNACTSSTDAGPSSSSASLSAPHATSPPPSTSSSMPPFTPPPSFSPTAADTMQAVHVLLESELRDGHIDLETFDFAGWSS
jgi:hypothetical protein